MASAFSSYAGPNLFELLLLIRKFNLWHPNRAIDISNITDMHIAQVDSLEAFQEERKAKYNKAQKEIDLFVKDLESIKNMRFHEEAATFDWASAASRGKNLLNLIETSRKAQEGSNSASIADIFSDETLDQQQEDNEERTMEETKQIAARMDQEQQKKLDFKRIRDEQAKREAAQRDAMRLKFSQDQLAKKEKERQDKEEAERVRKMRETWGNAARIENEQAIEPIKITKEKEEAEQALKRHQVKKQAQHQPKKAESAPKSVLKPALKPAKKNNTPKAARETAKQEPEQKVKQRFSTEVRNIKMLEAYDSGKMLASEVRKFD